MSGILDNRVAIVTGGARGIGLALSQIMVMQGAKVMIADNGCAVDGSPEDPVVASAAVDRCNQIAAGSAAAFNDNLAARGVAQELVSATRKTFGAIDIVVNNAAIWRADSSLYGDRDLFEYVIANNLTSAYSLLAASVPLMKEQRQIGRLPGTIVNVISAAGVYGDYGQSAYATAKAGLMGLTRATALDLKSMGITCNAVMPFADTRLSRAQASEKSTAIPASYVANLIAWLTSSQASAVTGQLLGVRGREVILFNQSRPQKTVFTGAGVLDADALGHSILEQFSAQFCDLHSSLEAFDSDPIL
jgi:NAD(P)-dependent dehydrogenase (short-subunit alcohol dehydrogenase family)